MVTDVRRKVFLGDGSQEDEQRFLYVIQGNGGSRSTLLGSVELPRIIPTKYRGLRIDT